MFLKAHNTSSFLSFHLVSSLTGIIRPCNRFQRIRPHFFTIRLRATPVPFKMARSATVVHVGIKIVFGWVVYKFGYDYIPCNLVL
jgi:hypothetical protein